MQKKYIYIVLIIILLIILSLFLLFKKNEKKDNDSNNEEKIVENIDFNSDIIKFSHEKDNYLISPYSIEIALNMLRDGANGNTKGELDKVLGNRKINFLSIKDKLSVSNALFLKDRYQNNILKSYQDNLKNKYDAEILLDNFATPTVINDWVNKKTNGMIPKLLDRIDERFVLGLANAVALDVKWKNEFECNKTKSGEFTLKDNSKINVEMMHQTLKNDNKYIKNDDYEGVIIPYEDTQNTKLEFVAFIPNKGIDNYIENMTSDKLNDLYNSFNSINENVEVNLSLPRFTYEYEINNFIGVLDKLGIHDAFKTSANFSNMINVSDVYFDEAIHKTKIELNEKGTKAAAVTYFGMKNFMLPQNDKQIIDITFNKPFVYMIKDANTNEILFFGTVYKPNVWNGSTCSN